MVFEIVEGLVGNVIAEADGIEIATEIAAPLRSETVADAGVRRRKGERWCVVGERPEEVPRRVCRQARREVHMAAL